MGSSRSVFAPGPLSRLILPCPRVVHPFGGVSLFRILCTHSRIEQPRFNNVQSQQRNREKGKIRMKQQSNSVEKVLLTSVSQPQWGKKTIMRLRIDVTCLLIIPPFTPNLSYSGTDSTCPPCPPCPPSGGLPPSCQLSAVTTVSVYALPARAEPRGCPTVLPVMAADLQPEWISCLPSSWSYGLTRDGRVFFIK